MEAVDPAVRPRPAWAPCFTELLEKVPDKRETSLELASGTDLASRSAASRPESARIQKGAKV
jgi:hypothetical protein